MHNVSGRCMGIGIGLREWDGNSHRNGKEWELIAWEWAGMGM